MAATMMSVLIRKAAMSSQKGMGTLAELEVGQADRRETSLRRGCFMPRRGWQGQQAENGPSSPPASNRARPFFRMISVILLPGCKSLCRNQIAGPRVFSPLSPIMIRPFLAAATLIAGLAVFVAPAARADIVYVGPGFTKASVLPPKSQFSPQPSWTYESVFVDPRIVRTLWRGSDVVVSHMGPTAAFEVGFGGPLGIADLSYAPARAERREAEDFAFQTTVTPVPEPSTSALIGAGLVAFAFLARQRLSSLL